jgi:cobalt-zinc-cadmium efflux system membrane fusion protein
MFLIRRPILPTLLSFVAAMCLSGCGEHEKSAAEETPPAPVRSLPKGEVSLGADAPELKQMSIEPVKTVNVPADEVVAPAKIEANPNQVGHAVLPVPGRVVRVMTKLGDWVKQGQPLLTVESAVIGEAESGYVLA